MPIFEYEEVNLSLIFLYSFLNMSQLHEPTFSRINYPHKVILNMTSLSDKDTVGQK